MPPLRSMAKPGGVSPVPEVERAFRLAFEDTTVRVETEAIRFRKGTKVHTVMVRLTASGVNGALIAEVPVHDGIPDFAAHASNMARAARRQWAAGEGSSATGGNTP